MLGTLLFAFIACTHAGTAHVDFLAPTNVPGVAVEGKADGIHVPYNEKSPQGTVVEIDVYDLKTGMDKRDQHLREKVFSAKNPGEVKIRFELTELDQAKGLLKGKLAIKGTVRDVELPVAISGGSVTGKTAIKLSDYSLPRPSFMGVKVEESVAVNFTFKE